AGKVMDDGTIARLDEITFRMTSAEPNLRWLQDNAEGLDVDIADVTDGIAALSLQGPAAGSILASIGAPALKYFRIAPATLHGIAVTVSRTGYTGDLGYEIWAEARDALALWDAVMEAGRPYGIMPAGLLALDMARLEAGLILIDVDYVPARKALIESQLSSPYELDLGWTALLKKYIALAHLRSRWAAPGTPLEMEMTVEHRRKRAAAHVVKKPFFDPPRKRA